jgi:hypothetical protein
MRRCARNVWPSFSSQCRYDYSCLCVASAGFPVVKAVTVGFLPDVRRHFAPSKDRQGKDRKNCKTDRKGEHRSEDAEVLRGDADTDNGDRESQVAQHEKRGDDLSSPLGRGQPVGGRETAHEDTADCDSTQSGGRQKQTQRNLRQSGNQEGEDKRKSARPKEATLG